jgi:uncharacterized protein YjbJ (UPF0337 family)
MNKNQVEGKAKEIAGEVQEHLGRAVGNKSQEAKGHAHEVEGKLQKQAGDVQEAVEDAADAAKRKLP